MPSPFPPFAALTLHRGNSENLQLIGVGVDGSVGLPAWQVGTEKQFDRKGGDWVIQGANLLSFQQRMFSATALGTGSGGELWVVGLSGDQRVYLAARQDPQGFWHAPSSGQSGLFGPTRQNFSAVATGTGDQGGLQILALGTDGKVYRVGYQEAGLWYSSTGGPLGDQARTYGSFAVARAADGTLQALGLGTDRKLYLVAHQDRAGKWQPPSAKNSGAIGDNSRPYAVIAVSPGNDRRLQVLGLGADGKVYLIAWLEGSDWKAPHDSNRNPLGNEGRPYVAIAAGTGNGGRLQVLGLGVDQKIYHVAWQETSGEWKRPRNTGPFGNPELSYSAVALGHGYKGDLQVVGLGAGFDDGLPYLVTRQDGNGNWHAGQPLFSGRSSPLEGNWETALPGGAWLNGCLAYDTVWLVTGDHAVRGFDHFTGAETHVFAKFGDSAVPRNVQPFEGGLLVFCADGWFYFVDLAPNAPEPERIAYCDGEAAWMQAQGGSVFAFSEKSGVVRVPPKAEGVPPSRDGQIVIGAYGAGYTVGWPSLGPDMVLAALNDGEGLCALNPVDLSRISSCPLPGRPSWIQTACNGAMAVVCVGDGKTVCAVPTGLGTVAWAVTFSAPVSYRLACDASYCYVPLADGSLKILNIADGTPAAGKPAIKLAAPLSAMVLDSGVLYGASSAGSFVCAIDIATGQVLTLPTAGGPTLAGAENGVVYFGDQKHVRALRLAGLFRRFYAEATLLQDLDIPVPGLGAPAKVPAIESEITLYDKAGGPYARQQVRVGATEPVEIWCNGVRHAIGTPDVPFATLATDVAGRVRIGLRPTNLTCPSLALFTTFMDGDLSLLLRPDSQLQDKLAGIKGSDLKAATGYDGKLIVKDEYRNNDTVLKNTADMMSASIQMVKGSLDNRQTLLAGTLTHRQMRYLARGCDMETICCCPQGDYTCRTVCNRNFAFDLDAATTSFGYLDPAETGKWLAAHPLSLTPPPPRLGSPEGWWDDFWEDVKDGAATVKNAIVYAVNEVADDVKTVISWVKEGATYTYEFVVDTIEKAVTLVQGIFNTIAGAVGKVLEALSFLFSRERIIGIKTQLKSQVEDAWTRLLGPDGQTETGLLFQVRDQVSGELAKLRKSIDEVLGEVRAQAGGVSGAAAQQRVAGASNPAKGGSTSRWLETKVGDNLLSTALRAGPSAAGDLPAGIPRFPIPAGLDRDVGDLVRQVEQVVGQEAASALRRIQSELDPDGTGTSLFGSAFSVIVNLMQLLADVAIEAAERIWVAMINVLAKLLRAIRAFTTTKFYLPVISELYAYFTGSPVDSMTILDLVCLLAAVPTSLLLPDSSGPKAAAAGAPVAQILGIASGAVQALATGFMGTYTAVVTALRADQYFGDVVRTNVKLIQSLIFLGVGGVARGLLLASDIYSNLHHTPALIANTALWVMPTLVLVGDCASVLLVNESMGWASKNLSLLFGVVCSIGMAAIMGKYHDLFQGNWPLITFNSLVAGAFFLRGLLVFADLMPEGGYRLTYQLAVLAVATGLLVGSGFVKMWGAMNPPTVLSDPGMGSAVGATA
jgi:hypothetical protein